MVSPTDFQNTAVAWIGAVSFVALALVGAVGRVMGELRQLREQSNSHAADIRSINEQVTQTALATPPAGTPATAPGTQTDSVTVSQTTTPGD